MSYKEISKEGYEHIQSAISELRKKVGTIELLSAGIKTILGAAFFAILFAAVVIGAILIGPLGAVLGAVFAALSVGIAGGIAYLIVQGLAVDERYKTMDKIIDAYTKALSDFEKLEIEFPL